MPSIGQLLRQRTQLLAGSFNSHRILLYSLISTIAVSAAILNALKNHSNFYSVAIYLSKSSRSVLILANFGFLLALLCGHIVQKIFFGALRANEVERLYDRLWFFITESLLAFTIFRDEFDVTFVVMFGFLLFVKSFHWLASDRIEWMDQRPYPGPSALFHIRMTILFVILWFTDFLLFFVAVESTVTHGVGGMVLFASEYGILMASVSNTVAKYLLSAYEFRRAGQRGGENAPPWEDKSMWVFYIELVTDFLKLTMYLVFFTIIITFYGVPLNIIRDVYVTARSFITRLRALHRYQTATRNMDQRYPNATEEEMSGMSDRTCIICREEMILPQPLEPGQAPGNNDGPNTTPKKLPCGHIFHFHCLRSWLERQQSCPTCRRTVLDANPLGPRPGVPGQPAVAGAPPQPAPFGGQNRNPGINNPMGNPLGFVGRLFGPPAQPGLPPPQFGQAQFPQNVHLNPPNMGGQPAIVIEYHIQYQLPRQPQPLQPPQALQPAPAFQGFPGPGGVWQPWPQGVANDAQDPPPHLPNGTPPASASTPTAQQTPPPFSSAQDRQDPPTPNEAAAAAALRRLNNGRPSASREPSVSLSNTRAPQSPQPNPASGSGSSVPHASASSSATQNARLDIPSLVPLYDFSAHSPSALRQMTASRPLPQASHQSFGAQSQPGTPRPHSRTPMPRGQSHDFRYQNANGSRPPISQLPPTLTEEQLAMMDKVTREAIDERLRVLEGVSGAIYRCIDDLMLVRSSLPASSPTTPSASPASPLGNQPESARSTSAVQTETESVATGSSNSAKGQRPVESDSSNAVEAG